jgi:hypothetical protein
VIKFIDGCCTGIFIARAFIVKNSAIALPKIMIFSFSSPVTIGILIGAGLLFGAFKAGEYILSRHYAYGQDLLKTRTERLEYLKNEVEIADLREKLFIAKHNANNLALNDVVITPVNVVTDARSYIYSFNFFSSYSGRGHQVLPIEEARTGVGVRVA